MTEQLRELGITVHFQPVGGVADVAVQALQLQWRDRPEPLALQALRGRLRAKNQNGYQFSVQGLQFTADDGLTADVSPMPDAGVLADLGAFIDDGRRVNRIVAH